MVRDGGVMGCWCCCETNRPLEASKTPSQVFTAPATLATGSLAHVLEPQSELTMAAFHCIKYS